MYGDVVVGFTCTLVRAKDPCAHCINLKIRIMEVKLMTTDWSKYFGNVSYEEALDSLAYIADNCTACDKDFFAGQVKAFLDEHLLKEGEVNG